ncbi:bifunctional adenosylcobinamide kinase/adenosylcobinamide-phosphate guanylyltransferase [Alkalilimnicola ehrlichii]|uniref:bifunctional adenosylcobinamide kinase/adenosylcobinamide-phosphate guanylyltransferase n=1 Tax=Alkalilimnicola ehrlichii TaxID=351052 RepID=UPI003BA17747
MRTLITGGIRSGKSRYAEQLARGCGWPVTYLATARQSDDTEMAERIRRHRERRPPEWRSLEVPEALAEGLGQAAGEGRCLLVDCLNLWVSNLLLVGEACLATEQARLLEVLPTLPGRIILVSNEVGMGLVPPNPLGRRFCDALGELNQAVAARCEQVVFTVAGQPLTIK